MCLGITKIIVHMCFGLPGTPSIAFDPNKKAPDVTTKTPDAATLTLHAFN